MSIVRTDVSEQRIASIIRMERVSEQETTLAVTSSIAYPDYVGDTFI
jgi:hypothetical protein